MFNFTALFDFLKNLISNAASHLQPQPLALQDACFLINVYSYVYGIPAVSVGQLSPGAPDLFNNRVIKTHRRYTKSTAEQVGFRNMINALVDQRAATPAAFKHEYIAPLTIIDIPDASVLSQPLTLALATPHYENQDILRFCIRYPDVSRLKLLIQAAEAIEHLHAHNVIHGHIHPDNILITDDRNVAVTDIAVYTEARRCLLFSSDRKVKIRRSFVYQAPEFLNPETDTFDPPTKAMDVFAFGSLILTTLTNDAPYRERNLLHVLSEIMQHGHSGILLSSSGIISDDLLNLVRRCWAPNPIDRPTMGEVVAALVSF
jgi:serine/threonine protein kinase